LVERHNVAVFSSNFALYGDISSRVLTTLLPFADQIESYSIDENFLLLANAKGGLLHYGKEVKRTVFQHVRVPVSVGIAPSKTLAKLATMSAKKIPQIGGVCVLDAAPKWNWVLKRIAPTEIWGIGKRIGARLHDSGIYTGYDLATSDPKRIRKICGVNIERTVAELNGISAFELEEHPPAKKQIYVTRSFGTKTAELQPILEAISGHASLAAQKVRAQNHLATTITVFIHTSRFGSNFHQASRVVQLPHPTNDERDIIRAARMAVTEMYNMSKSQPHLYAKAGLGILDAVDKKYHQGDLLTSSQSSQSQNLMSVLDSIRKTQGRGSIFIGARGCTPVSSTAARNDFHSAQYTTKWSDIPIVKA